MHIQTKKFVPETTDRMGFCMTSADCWQISIAIDRKFMHGYDAEIDEDEDEIHNLMAAHMTQAATTYYGRNTELLHQLSAHSIDLFRTISDRWQPWLCLISRLPHREGEECEVKEAVPLERWSESVGT